MRIWVSEWLLEFGGFCDACYIDIHSGIYGNIFLQAGFESQCLCPINKEGYKETFYFKTLWEEH